jgi:hypothetical protein
MNNPVLIETAAKQRLADLRRTGERSIIPRQRERVSSWPTTRVNGRTAFANGRRVVDARQATGWLLVSIGLRLAVPRPRAGSAR